MGNDYHPFLPLLLTVLLPLLLLLLSHPQGALADLPVHCVKWNVTNSVWDIRIGPAVPSETANDLLCGHTRPDDGIEVLKRNLSYEAPGFETTRTGYVVLYDDYNSTARLCLNPDGVIEGNDSMACERAAWTMIYDEGFYVKGETTGAEVLLNFAYEVNSSMPYITGYPSIQEAKWWVSRCDRTFPGWFYSFSESKKACAVGKNRVEMEPTPSGAGGTAAGITSAASTDADLHVSLLTRLRERLGITHHQALLEREFSSTVDVAAINAHQSLWVASEDSALAVHEQGATFGEVFSFFGGARTKIMNSKSYSLDDITDPQEKAVETLRRRCMKLVLPRERDWSLVESVSTPVMNQRSCGSCYAVASADSATMRLRLTGELEPPGEVSVQEVLDCSPENQGCKGGFPFLAMYHGAHHGFVSKATCDAVVRYRAEARPKTSTFLPQCDAPPLAYPPRKTACEKTYVPTGFGYVGGAYGFGNEADMMWSLERDGPLVVAVNAKEEFSYYQSGVYVPSSSSSSSSSDSGGGSSAGHDPDVHKSKKAYWEATTHAVVLVGYTDVVVEDASTGENVTLPVWKVKNSWGKQWGMKGYFYLQRGADVLAVESMPVHAQFSNEPGNKDFLDSLRVRLNLLSDSDRSECADVIEALLAEEWTG